MQQPRVGDVLKGYRFLGGDPNEQQSWELVPTAAPMPVPNPGDVVKGYRFLGGDPNKEENWELPTEEPPTWVERNLPFGETIAATADIPIQVARGVVGVGKTFTDAAGAGNVASDALAKTIDFLRSLTSAQSRKDEAEISRLIHEAKGKGIGEEIKAAASALGVAPFDLLSQGIGSLAPFVAAAILAPAPTATAVGLGLGAVSGAGTVKGSIYDATKQELTKKGVSPEQAEAAAQQAQAYSGENLDMIALGSVLGGIAASAGVEPAVARGVAENILGRTFGTATAETAAKTAADRAVEEGARGLGRAAARTAAVEFTTEGLQGGQEALAQNIALQRQGIDVPTSQGVAGQAALEGTLGGIIGAPVGAYGGVKHNAFVEQVLRAREAEAARRAEAKAQATPAAETDTPVRERLAALFSDPDAGFLEAEPTPEVLDIAEQLIARGMSDTDALNKALETDEARKQFAGEEFIGVKPSTEEEAPARKAPAEKSLYDYALENLPGEGEFVTAKGLQEALSTASGRAVKYNEVLPILGQLETAGIVGAPDKKNAGRPVLRRDLFTPSGGTADVSTTRPIPGGIEPSISGLGGEAGVRGAATATAETEPPGMDAAGQPAGSPAGGTGTVESTLDDDLEAYSLFNAKGRQAPVELVDRIANRIADVYSTARDEQPDWSPAAVEFITNEGDAFRRIIEQRSKTEPAPKATEPSGLDLSERVSAGEPAGPDTGRTGAGEPPLGAEQAPPAKYGRPANTVAQVNAALAAEGIPQTLQKGNGYFYFIPNSNDVPEIPSVSTNSIRTLNLGWWVDYARSQHAAAMEKRLTPEERAAVLAKFRPVPDEFAPFDLDTYEPETEDAFNVPPGASIKDVSDVKAARQDRELVGTKIANLQDLHNRFSTVLPNLPAEERPNLVKTDIIPAIQQTIATVKSALGTQSYKARTKEETKKQKEAREAAQEKAPVKNNIEWVLRDAQLAVERGNLQEALYNLEALEIMAVREDYVAEAQRDEPTLVGTTLNRAPHEMRSPAFFSDAVSAVREAGKVDVKGLARDLAIPVRAAQNLVSRMENAGVIKRRGKKGWEIVSAKPTAAPTKRERAPVREFKSVAEMQQAEADRRVAEEEAKIRSERAAALGPTVYTRGQTKNTLMNLAPNAFRGYEGGGRPRRRQVRANQRLAKLIEEFDAGLLTSKEFEDRVRQLSSTMTQTAENKAFEKEMTPRVRGADIVRQRLLEFSRRGELDPGDVEFALWVIGKNPAMAEGVAISVKQAPEGKEGVAGDYNAVEALVQIFKGHGAAGTEVHEILHHTERMMPEHIQRGIADAWGRAYAKALAKSTGKQREALQLILPAVAGDRAARASLFEAFADGTLDVATHYQLSNPSEFWAVNATRILNNRYDAATSKKPWVRAARQWLSEFVQRAKGWFGLRSDSAILAGLREVLATEGEQASGYRSIADMLGGAAPSRTFESISYSPRTEAAIAASRASDKRVAGFVSGIRGASGAADFVTTIMPGIGVGAKKLLAKALPKADIVRTIQRLAPSIGAKSVAGLAKQVDEQTNRLIETRGKIIRDTLKRGEDWEEYNQIGEDARYALVDTMNISTLYGVDPTTAPDAEAFLRKENTQFKPDRRAEVRDVYALWNKLGTFGRGKFNGQELYKAIRDDYVAVLDKQERLLIDIIMNTTAPSTARSKLLTQIQLQFQEARKLAPYFPLSRFGPYAYEYNPNPGSKGTTGKVFDMSESMAARDLKVAEFAESLGKTRDELIRDGYLKEINGSTDVRTYLNNSSKVLNDIYTLLDQATATGQPVIPVDQFKDEVYKMFLLTLPDADMRKRFQPRKGIAGFSGDALRTYHSNMHAAAYQLARLEHSGDIRKLVAELKGALKGNPQARGIEPYVDELIAHVNREILPKDPSDETALDKLATFGTKASFIWMLTSIKSALIQLTQLPIVGFPVLSSRYGATETAAMAARYLNVVNSVGISRRTTTAKGDTATRWEMPSIEFSRMMQDPRLRAAFEAGVAGDVFTLTYAALASGYRRSPSEAGNNALSRGFTTAMNLITGGMHHTERLSREIMFMSAYELAYNKYRKEGTLSAQQAHEQAIEDGKDLTSYALYDYSQYNKPTVMKYPLGRLAFQFMSYPLQMVSFLTRNVYNGIRGLDKAERKQARSVLFGVLGMTFAFAGMSGMPLMGLLFGFLDGIRNMFRDEDDEEYEFDDPLSAASLKWWFYNVWVPETFGPDSPMAKTFGYSAETGDLVARSIISGPIAALTDLDVNTGTGLNNLFFRSHPSGNTNKEDYYQGVVGTLFGPTGALGAQIASALDEFSNDEYARGFEKLVPAFFRGMVRTSRLAEEGNLTRTGAEIKGPEFYTTGKLLAQSIGFGSTEVHEIQKRNTEAKNIIKDDARERTKLFRRLDEAFASGDDARINAAYEAIFIYNRRSPDPINAAEIRASMRERARGRAEAIEGLMVPKAWTPYLPTPQ